MGKVAGQIVLQYLYPVDSWLMDTLVQKWGDSVIAVGKNDILVEGIVPGDDPEKGLSLVTTFGAHELWCIKPTRNFPASSREYQAEFQRVQELCLTGCMTLEDFRNGDSTSNNPHCPYK